MNKSLIICAGLGSTGTSALDNALGILGFTTAKWTHVTEQPSQKHIPSMIMKPLMHGRYVKGMFDHVDAILDSPAIDHLPWILDDYPHSKIILTVRDPRKWALRRFLLHPCSSPPFFTWYEPYKSKCTRTPPYVLEHSYLAWYAYVQTLCRERNLKVLILNLFEEDDQQLWKRLAEFLGVNTKQFRGKFGKRKRALPLTAQSQFHSHQNDNHLFSM